MATDDDGNESTVALTVYLIYGERPFKFFQALSGFKFREETGNIRKGSGNTLIGITEILSG